MESLKVDVKAQVEAIKKDWRAIEDMENPSEQAQLEAVKANPEAIGYIINPCESAQLEAVKHDGLLIDEIWSDDDLSDAVQIEAIKENPVSLYFLTRFSKISDSLLEEAIKLHGIYASWFLYPTGSWNMDKDLEALKVNPIYSVDYYEEKKEWLDEYLKANYLQLKHIEENLKF